MRVDLEEIQQLELWIIEVLLSGKRINQVQKPFFFQGFAPKTNATLGDKLWEDKNKITKVEREC